MAKRYTREQVIKRIEEVHPGKFGFDRFIFTKMVEKSWLECPTHGYFEISPHKVLSGRDCRKCSDFLKGNKFRREFKTFVQQARLVHGNQYKYRNYTHIVNDTIPYDMYCRACKRTIKQRVCEHLQGKHHKDCVNVKKRGKTGKRKDSITVIQRKNKKMSKEWQYTPDWSEEEMMNGSYCGYVYLFQFDDGTSYVGSKQIYKRVKDAKKIKPNSVENGWRDYSSSSRIVNQKIADGEEYTKTILWCFPTMKDTLLVETALIVNEGLKPGNLNLSIMHKARLPTGDDKKRLFGVLKELLSYLN